MKTTFLRQPIALALSAIALLAIASDPARAREKRQPVAKFSARAFSVDRGKASNLDIVIYEWTTPEERQALIQTFLDGGSDALYDALANQTVKGYLKAPGTLAYDMTYARSVDLMGKRRIVLATDRPMGFLELARNTRSTDYNVSLVLLEIDLKTGEGEGSAVGGAELSVDEATNRLSIEFAGTQPTKLVKVRQKKVRQKGRE